MKNDIEYYRKFSLIDYEANPKKYKEYLELCKKNNHLEEKCYIMQSLINLINEKSVSSNQKSNESIMKATQLCVSCFFYADLEIENFFKLNNFSVNFQRTILLKAIDYSENIRLKDQNPKEISFLKYQFWVLKTINKHAEATGSIDFSSHISQDELNQSLINLEKEILKGNFNDKNILFLMKAAYELGFFYYLTNEFDKMKFFFDVCLQRKNDIKNDEMKFLYFDIDDLKKLIDLLIDKDNLIKLSKRKCFQELFDMENCKDLAKNDIEMINGENVESFKNQLSVINKQILEDDQEYYMSKMDLEKPEKIINNNNYNSAIPGNNVKFKILDFSNRNKSNDNIKREISEFFNVNQIIDNERKTILEKFSFDDSKTFDYFSIPDQIHYSKNLLLMAYKNYSQIYSTITYLKKLSENLSNQYNRASNKGIISENDQKIFIYAEKEIAHYHHLANLIDLIYKKEEKLPKNLLKNLSQTIIDKTLTDDLEISGLIHGSIINFHRTFSKIFNYFNDFVEFFQKRTDETQEKVNQINYIYCVVKIINMSVDEKNSNQNSIIIEDSDHSTLLNLIFYWIKLIMENKISKKQNILFILIKTIKNSEYLSILKIILLGALKFLSEKKCLINKTYNNEIYEKINHNNINFLSIDNLINENSKNNIKKLNNKTFFFKEDSKKTYNFVAENIVYYENILINLIKKCEKKIVKFGEFTEKEILERKLNLLFFEIYPQLIEKMANKIQTEPSKNLNSNQSIKSAEENHFNMNFDDNNKKNDVSILNIFKLFSKYLILSFSEYKIKYFKCDMFKNENLNKINIFYSEFKEMMNENLIMKFVFLFYLKGKNLDSCILLQYLKDIDYDLIYKLLESNPENHILNKLEYIWKIPFFEILANSYFKLKKDDSLNMIKNLIRRTSNHQIFKSHVLRKHFKILNFLKYIENLEYSLIR